MTAPPNYLDETMMNCDGHPQVDALVSLRTLPLREAFGISWNMWRNSDIWLSLEFDMEREMNQRHQ